MENQHPGNGEIAERADIIRHKLKFIQQKPVVAVLAGLRPVKFDAGILADKISTAGGMPWAESGEGNSAEILIVYAPEHSLGEIMSQLSTALEQHYLLEIPAVQQNRIYIIDTGKTGDKNSIFLLESLAEIIQPKQFVFGYEGDYWIRFGM